MLPQEDIKHLTQHIERNTTDAQKLRQQADTERERAMQALQQNQDGKQSFHNTEADKLEQKALELEEETTQLEAMRDQVQKRVDSLIQQRDGLPKDQSERITALDKEIKQLQGDHFML